MPPGGFSEKCDWIVSVPAPHKAPAHILTSSVYYITQKLPEMVMIHVLIVILNAI